MLQFSFVGMGESRLTTATSDFFGDFFFKMAKMYVFGNSKSPNLDLPDSNF